MWAIINNNSFAILSFTKSHSFATCHTQSVIHTHFCLLFPKIHTDRLLPSKSLSHCLPLTINQRCKHIWAPPMLVHTHWVCYTISFPRVQTNIEIPLPNTSGASSSALCLQSPVSLPSSPFLAFSPLFSFCCWPLSMQKGNLLWEEVLHYLASLFHCRLLQTSNNKMKG